MNILLTLRRCKRSFDNLNNLALDMIEIWVDDGVNAVFSILMAHFHVVLFKFGILRKSNNLKCA